MNGRGIVYIRRSRSKQEKSLKQQLAWAIERAHADEVELRVKHGDETRAIRKGVHVLGDLYLDDAITGADLNRPGFLAFIRRAKEDSVITHVFFWKRDRFARPEEALHAVELEKSIRCAEKTVVTSTGQFPPIADRQNSMGDDIQMLIEYSEAGRFRPDLAQKVLRAAAANAESGYSTGRRAPYGFGRFLVDVETRQVKRRLEDKETTGKEGCKVLILPGDAPEDRRKLRVVRRIALEYHDGLGGLQAIAARLNADGIPSPDAGRKRNGRPVSGKWTISSVREVLEQPLYIGKVPWARHGEGAVYRYDRTKAERARKLTPAETEPDGGNGLARKLSKREKEDWVLVSSPIPYKPIVSEDIWQANYRKLRDRGSKGQGRRGVPRCSDPNKYPLRVVCGMCGQPMQGTRHDGVRVFSCSTYLNTNAKKCAHNWIERDRVVAFVVNAVRESLSADGQKDALRKVIRRWLKHDKGSRTAVDKDIRDLEAKLASVERQRQQAYRDKLEAEREETRRDAERAYDDLMKEYRAVSEKLENLKSRAGNLAGDSESQVKACLSVLKRLHLFLGRVPDNLLRRTFEALGARLTVDFERTKEGRRKTVPVGGRLELGVNGKVDAEGLVRSEADKDEGDNGRARRMFAGTKRAAAALAETKTPNAPSADWAEGTLGVVGRGGQI